MKGVHCSWVDMQKIRQALANGERGDQARLEQMRCVDQNTVSSWQRCVDVMSATEGKVQISVLSHVQPSHAVEIARHLRRQHGPSAGWTEEVKDEAVELVQHCEDEALTVQRLKRHLRQKALAVLPADTPPLPARKYRCIVADPPWPVDKFERDCRPAQGPLLDYAVMPLEEIAALPVRVLADQGGCHLYLWVTHRYLPLGLSILTAWGFKYHCLLTWIKPVGMAPLSWMFNTEHVLFGYAGALGCERPGLKVSFEAEAPRGRHSRKPDVFYERVCQFSRGPRLSMFEREEREGFEGWGNELPGGLEVGERTSPADPGGDRKTSGADREGADGDG
jgi:N6-adenosine-specific RNA methylase IME4